MSARTKFQAIKGVRDILPPESALWNRVEQTAREVFATYGFGEIRLPIFEETELFARSVGVDTDIVGKEMYTFGDPPESPYEYLQGVLGKVGHERFARLQGSELDEFWTEMREHHFVQLVSLRPEATASVVRAYIEHGVHMLPGDAKLYYIGPMFRRERPQKGRYRQFYQIGAEVLGQSDHPALDAEVIEMVMVYLDRLGLAGCTLHINSIGCKECRPAYVAKLKEALVEHINDLKADSQRRVETNPLRVLDSKLPEEQAVIETLPRIADHLCPTCREHFARVQEQLQQRGISYEVNWRLVRGLDYYTRTTFEITAPGLGAQNAICGGGRYDGLVELLGGPPTKGIGFAIGTDRVVLALEEAKTFAAKPQTDVFVAWLGAAAYPMAVRVARRLREAGFAVELPHEEMKFKKSLSLAARLGARFAVILGDDEVAAGACTVKRLADGSQQKVAEAALVEYLRTASKV